MPNFDIVVLAGSNREYIDWCAEQDVRPWGEGYAYLSSQVALEGRMFAGVKIIGKFWNRRNADDLYRIALAARQAEF